MSFIKNLAKGGLMGLGGLAAAGAFKKKKKEEKPAPSLTTGDYNTNTGGSSLVNQRSIY